jgi:hypothetical protein
MPINKRYWLHEGDNVDIAAGTVGFVPQTIMLFKPPTPNGWLPECHYAFNAFRILSLNIVGEYSADRASRGVTSNRNSHTLTIHAVLNIR